MQGTSVFILYPATLLYSLISSSNFLVESLDFLCKGSRHLQIVSFTSFLIWIPFISFSTLIAMAKTCKTMLNSSGESGHPCLVPDFRGNAFSFSPLRIMFAVGLSYIAFYYALVYSFYSCFLERFYHKLMLNFVKGFLCIY